MKHLQNLLGILVAASPLVFVSATSAAVPAPYQEPGGGPPGGGPMAVLCCTGAGADCLFGDAGACIARCKLGQGCVCHDGSCVLGFPAKPSCYCK